MKNTLVALMLLISAVFVSCGHKNHEQGNAVSNEAITSPATEITSSEKTELPIIQFENVEHDFGVILQGEKVTHSFKFKNIGKNKLIIKNASASCGCTVPKFTSDEIAPGEEGVIEVVFDSSNRTGRQIKTITVWTNCQPEQTKLQITSEIVVPK